MGHEERFPLPRRVAAIGSVKGPSPEYPVTTGKRRFRPFAALLWNRGSRPLFRHSARCMKSRLLQHPTSRVEFMRLRSGVLIPVNQEARRLVIGTQTCGSIYT